VIDTYVHTVSMMGTVVTIQVVGRGDDERKRRARVDAVERAVEWFRRVENCCTRFDARSEARQLSSRIGASVAVSPMLYEVVQFALAVAEESGGAFDPTVGLRMESRGFDREYRTGAVVRSEIGTDASASYRDVRLDPVEKTITLLRPLVLDLGAVAKGLAIDMATRELAEFQHFAIDAGGDLYLAGRNAQDAPWAVGIRHPRSEHGLIETLRVSDAAVCTSGDYERRSPNHDGGHHIIDPRTGQSAESLASVTVIAETAMVADALATASFVLGPVEGLHLLERHGVDALLVTSQLEQIETSGLERHRAARHRAAATDHDG
jgi:FAD:protein FMN transferase